MADYTQLETEKDIGESPSAITKRWKLELKLADKRESAWRKKAKDIYGQYTPENPKANSFNILWTNTETLRQACYNSLPEPQVKRRYQDDDPLGMRVSEVLTRALQFSQETYDFDHILKSDVLAMLLAGRTVSRVRYVPSLREIGAEDSSSDDDLQESEAYEEIEWEQVLCENVQYDDFRISSGKTWNEVCWVAFRHQLAREELVEKFGEDVGNKIPLDQADDEDVKNSKEVADLFKTAEIWEIWDKDKKKVVWICKTYDSPCKVQDDPLGLQDFYPIPRPLYAIENNHTLVPAALFSQYEQQAAELNRISIRINKLIEGLKNRGIYDSTLSELSQLSKANDNELIPAENVTALLERGGLDKAIWFMPMETCARVLQELYTQRDQTKQIIYEITGISDIMRSASDPNETFGAQRIKTQWGTQRLQKMQKEVQRYIRDLIRLKAEIISEKFQPETLEQMTLVQMPHQTQVDIQNKQAMLQYQQQAQQAQMSGQPPPQPPQPQDPVTWEKVIAEMHDDSARTYRIDIETDSTLSAEQDSDMQGLTQLLTGVTQFINGIAPAVERGALPIDAVKEVVLTICRRAKMGSAVEDAFAKMQAPKPAPDPNAGKAQAQMQIEQMKAQLSDQQHQRELQANMQAEQQSAQLAAQVEQHKQEMQAQQIAHQNTLEAQRAQQQMHNESILEQMRIESDERMKAIENQQALLIAQMNNAAKIEVAEISAATTLQAGQIAAANQSVGE
jgi:hypothetical protein